MLDSGPRAVGYPIDTPDAWRDDHDRLRGQAAVIFCGTPCAREWTDRTGDPRSHVRVLGPLPLMCISCAECGAAIQTLTDEQCMYCSHVGACHPVPWLLTARAAHFATEVRIEHGDHLSDTAWDGIWQLATKLVTDHPALYADGRQLAHLIGQTLNIPDTEAPPPSD